MPIKTISSEQEHKIKEKGSLFIGKAFPINSPEEAEDILKKVRKEYYDATHHCYAYLTIESDPKYSDDGEPNGTAGIRILNAINHHDLVNVLVIVIRYFGGTKLGVGPLGKAYYLSAEQTLNGCNIVEKENFSRIEIEYDYPYSKTVHHYLGKFSAQSIENEYKTRPIILCYIQSNLTENFKESLLSATNNKVKINIHGDAFLFAKRQT